LTGLATALVVLFIVLMIVDSLSFVAHVARYSVVGEFLDDGVGVSDLEAADVGVGLAAVAHLLLVIATAAVFIVWQYRHARNASSLGARGLGPGWAIGGWFIPCANIVLPAIQLAQSARDSDPYRVGRRPPPDGRIPPVVIVWAVVFALAYVASAGSAAATPAGDEPLTRFQAQQELEDLQAADAGAAIADVLFVAAAGLALAMVRTLSQRQAEAVRRYEAQPGLQGAGPAPPWSGSPPWSAWPQSPPPGPGGGWPAP
jgi:hypothetical protein